MFFDERSGAGQPAPVLMMRIAFMWQNYRDGRKAVRRVNIDCPESADGIYQKGLYARQDDTALAYLERNGNPVFGVDPVPDEVAEVMKCPT